MLFIALVFLIIFNGGSIKKAFNNSAGNNMVEKENQAEVNADQTSNEQEKNYIEKNLESIKIIKDEIIDIASGQGCLIRPETTILFGPDDDGNIQKIKNFEKPYKVTSHGFVHCTEIIGELSNGDKFYIHAQSLLGFEKTFYLIIKKALKESSQKKIAVNRIRIKNDFSAYSQEKIVREKNEEYKKKCESLDIKDENIEIKSERFTESTPEKVISYLSEEWRENF